MCWQPAIHKIFSIMIDPGDVMRYVFVKVPPFVGPNVVSNAPTDWLSIRYCHFARVKLSCRPYQLIQVLLFISVSSLYKSNNNTI